MRIRGWLGPPRWDAELAHMATYAAQWADGKAPPMKDLTPRWPRGLPIPTDDDDD